MYELLTSEDIVDIVMFINSNGIGSNPNYMVGKYNSLMDFEMRRLRSLFFNYRIIGYGDTIYEDGIKVIKSLILFSHSSAPNASHIFLSLAPMDNEPFLRYAIMDVIQRNANIIKIRAVTTQRVLNKGFEVLWNRVGLKYELCLRNCKKPDDRIISYCYENQE